MWQIQTGFRQPQGTSLLQILLDQPGVEFRNDPVAVHVQERRRGLGRNRRVGQDSGTARPPQIVHDHQHVARRQPAVAADVGRVRWILPAEQDVQVDRGRFRLQQAVAGHVGEPVRAAEARVRRVGKRPAGLQVQAAACWALPQDGRHRLAVQFHIVRQDALRRGHRQRAVPQHAVAIVHRDRRVVDAEYRDGDRGDVRVEIAVVGPVREPIGAEEVGLGRVEERTVQFQRDRSVLRPADQQRPQQVAFVVEIVHQDTGRGGNLQRFVFPSPIGVVDRDGRPADQERSAHKGDVFQWDRPVDAEQQDVAGRRPVRRLARELGNPARFGPEGNAQQPVLGAAGQRRDAAASGFVDHAGRGRIARDESGEVGAGNQRSVDRGQRGIVTHVQVSRENAQRRQPEILHPNIDEKRLASRNGRQEGAVRVAGLQANLDVVPRPQRGGPLRERQVGRRHRPRTAGVDRVGHQI